MKKITVMALGLGLMVTLGMTKPAEAVIVPISHWDIELWSRTIDTTRSGADTLGFDWWATWTYRVTANSDVGSTEPGEFTHLGIGLPSLPYISSSGMLDEILASMDAVGGSPAAPSPDYSPFEVRSGGPIGGMGLHVEWNNQDDRVVFEDDYDEFSFSTPYAEIDTVALGLKIPDGERVYVFDELEGPGALDDPERSNAVPEPATMLLFGSGMVGAFLKRRKKA